MVCDCTGVLVHLVNLKTLNVVRSDLEMSKEGQDSTLEIKRRVDNVGGPLNGLRRGAEGRERGVNTKSRQDGLHFES